MKVSCIKYYEKLLDFNIEVSERKLELLNGKLLNLDKFQLDYNKYLETWIAGRNENAKHSTLINDMKTRLNELFVAFILCENNDVKNVIYEKPLMNTKKTIDFHVQLSSGIELLIDVKSIIPDRKDKWEEYVTAIKNDYIHGGLHFFEEGFGGEDWHKMTAARGKMLDYSIELEEKIDQIDDNNYKSLLLFCGNDNDWYIDELEDYVEFYLTSDYSHWDHLQKITAFYLKREQKVMKRTINGFACLLREDFSDEYKFSPFVRMNKLFRNK